MKETIQKRRRHQTPIIASTTRRVRTVDDVSKSPLDTFSFKRRRERLNWRMIAGIDLERITQEVNSVNGRVD